MEVWRPVTRFEYEVSTSGRVRRGGRIIKGQIVEKRHLIHLWRGGFRYCFRIASLVALAFIPNPNNLPEVDHIDRNSLNNFVGNLRWADRSLNTANTRRKSKLGYKGVSYQQHAKRFKAKIKYNQKQYHLGYFKTAKEAANAYNEAARALWGEFACLNRI